MCAVTRTNMEKTFGKKDQYSDHEYDIAMDLKLFRCKSEMITHKFEKYMELEKILNWKESSVWYEMLKRYIGDYKPTLDVSLLDAIFKFTPSDISYMFDVLCRKTPKKKTLVFYGPSNCGKSLLANALLAPIAPGYIQRDGGTNVHWLENIYRKSVILWEEPSVNMSIIEDVKLLLGGETIPINRKNKQIIERPAGPAVVVTTNNQFWYYQPDTLENRITIYELTTQVGGIVGETYIKKNDIIYYILDVYNKRK